MARVKSSEPVSRNTGPVEISKSFGEAADTFNPLMTPPPDGVPAFDLIKPKHFLSAIDWAIRKAEADLQAIRDNPDPPDFKNTVEALEFAGADIVRVQSIVSWLSANNKSADGPTGMR